jgi:glucose/arabinose dehydrogenase
MPESSFYRTDSKRWKSAFATLMIGATAAFIGFGCVRAANPEASPDQTNAPEKVKIAALPKPEAASGKLLTGKAALGDWTTAAPGVRRRITTADLPKPYDTPSVDNGPNMIPRPSDAMPKVPAGFKVDLFASDLYNPRVLITAPNGDIFVAESEGGRIHVLRDENSDGKPEVNEVFTSGLNKPFGLAFYPPGPNPQYLYVANTDSVIRFSYRNGDTKARGNSEMIISRVPEGGRLRGGGHWTRDIAFSKDGKKMWVSIGSRTNVDEETNERACIHEYTPDGKNFRIYAGGIRNPVGIAVHPVTGDLWTSVNERDGLGDNLVPDYVTKVKEGGFYGWPWYYIGPHQDPRHEGGRPDLRDKVIVPDVLIESHSASLDLAFYTGDQFPDDYRNDIFAAEHGSWNRSRRDGYKVIRVPVKNGKATGEYEDFMTGFITSEGYVWGRPVGVTVGKDGSLFVSDDGSNAIWRVTYKK